MNYKHYFPRLSEIEERLFEEGYWTLGWVDTTTMETPIIVTHNIKWIEMINYFDTQIDFKKHIITPEMVEDYLDNPNPVKTPRHKNIRTKNKRRVTYKRKDGSIKEYEYNYIPRKNTNKKPNTD